MRSVDLRLVVTLTLALASGCAPAPDSRALCELECACEGCSEAEREACGAALDRSAGDAARADCGEAFEARAACVTEHLACVDGRVEVLACEAEERALVACLAEARVDRERPLPDVSGGPE